MVGVGELLPLQTGSTTFDLAACLTAAGADAHGTEQIKRFGGEVHLRQRRLRHIGSGITADTHQGGCIALCLAGSSQSVAAGRHCQSHRLLLLARVFR